MAPKQPGVVKPKMSKMYDGRNVATRPIPIITDTAEQRAIAAAALDNRPRGDVVNMPSGPRPVGAKTVLGTQVGSLAKLATNTFNPAAGITEFE